MKSQEVADMEAKLKRAEAAEVEASDKAKKARQQAFDEATETFRRHFTDASMKVAKESMSKAAEYMASQSAEVEGQILKARRLGYEEAAADYMPKVASSEQRATKLESQMKEVKAKHEMDEEINDKLRREMKAETIKFQGRNIALEAWSCAKKWY